MSDQSPITVAILARDAVSGQALELLLQSAGYNTLFIVETAVDRLAEAFNGARLLLIAPPLSARHREDFVKGMRSVPEIAQLPVLELITVHDGTRPELEGHVLWPCRMEVLKEKIEAALMSGSHGELAC